MPNNPPTFGTPLDQQVVRNKPFNTAVMVTQTGSFSVTQTLQFDVHTSVADRNSTNLSQIISGLWNAGAPPYLDGAIVSNQAFWIEMRVGFTGVGNSILITGTGAAGGIPGVNVGTTGLFQLIFGPNLTAGAAAGMPGGVGPFRIPGSFLQIAINPNGVGNANLFVSLHLRSN